MLRTRITILILAALLAACVARDSEASVGRVAETGLSGSCPVTEPHWLRPPEDFAVQSEPQPGYYFVNEDRSIWASAWWWDTESYTLRASENGVKVGWFRPAGSTLAITGQRLDAQALPLEANVPCCYPTRFQATGLEFPVEGCWEVVATAADRTISFVVEVER